jgi:hypothetical protein
MTALNDRRKGNTKFLQEKHNMNRSVAGGLTRNLHFMLAGLLSVLLLLATSTSAQVSAASSPVPTLVNFSGTITDANGKPLAGVQGVTFFLYKDANGSSAPLWLETQNVQADSRGHYTVMLGSTTTEGLPKDLFASGEARWLAVQPEGQDEQPRVLLLSVPYALKAADAETVGGLPASAFVLATTSNKSVADSSKTAASTAAVAPVTSSKPTAVPSTSDVTTTGGTVKTLPLWSTATNIQSSAVAQSGSGATAKIGIATTAPAATLDVAGKGDIRDTLTLFPKGSDPTLAISGTAFNIDQTGKMTFISGQTFPGAGTITGITTAGGSGLSGGGTSGTLNLKVPTGGITNAMLQSPTITLNANAAGGVTTPGAMTLGGTFTLGLKACSTKQILQFNGTSWNCANAGTGTVTSVASGTGLTGGPITSSGTLKVDPTVVPELATANTFTNTNTLNANSTSPALSVTNSAGDGIDISVPGSESNGVYVTDAGFIGVFASAEYGGSFTGTEVGVEGINYADFDFFAGTYAFEFGSTTETRGLWASSSSPLGTGTYSEAVSASTEGTTLGEFANGIWGDTSATAGNGVLGTADNGNALFGVNNSTQFATGFFGNSETSFSDIAVLQAQGLGFGGLCTIDVSGNLSCNGSITPTVPVAGGARQVGLSGISSPENWFEDIGSAQLTNGAAVVNIEPVFGETVNTSVDYHVFLTPNGECRGLYVTQKSPTSFVVREQGGGTSSIAFDYRIVAKRRGFEGIRLLDKTKAMTLPTKSNPAASKRPAMPKPRDLIKSQQAHLHSAHLAKPVSKTK